MSDTLMTILGIFLAVLLMFLFPLMEIGGKNDEISQTVVQVVVSDFVNKVATQGKITEFDYDELVQKLHATGNSYDIQIEAKILDDNPRRSTTTGDSNLLGEYKYYSVYTNTILEELENEQEYLLKNDDYIVVTVKNTNITMGTQLKNFLYNLIGKDTYTIGTSASALVLNGGQTSVDPEATLANVPPKPEYVVKEVTIYVSNVNYISSNVTFVLDITGSMGSTSGASGYTNRMDMVRKNVKTFLQSIEMPENEDRDNPIINVVRFGTTSEITTSGINTKGELSSYLNERYDALIDHRLSNFIAYENYDLGLEDALRCVRQNKTTNSNPNIVIIITDGQKAYNSSYCISHNGNMSEYARKLITDEGAIVYAVGIQTSTDVLDSMVLDPNTYCYQIYNNVGLNSLLSIIRQEIIAEEKTSVISRNGKILLEKITEISTSKPLTIKISGITNQEIVVNSPSNSLIEEISGEYWLVLEKLAARVGGVEVLDNCSIELHY